MEGGGGRREEGGGRRRRREEGGISSALFFTAKSLYWLMFSQKSKSLFIFGVHAWLL